MRVGDNSVQSVIPAEWSPQAALWTAWPSHSKLWDDQLELARIEVARMVAAVARDQKVKVLAMGEEAEISAHAMIGGFAEILPAQFGDIWLRDTGPIFTSQGVALRFKTNGWGGKYVLPFDDSIGDAMASFADSKVEHFDFVLEGGAVEQNGAGLLLSTRQCLLNPNRQNGWDESKAETALRDAFGVGDVMWLDNGLKNDHTDGHIDNVARFVRRDLIVCQSAFGNDDPNSLLFESVFEALSAYGEKFDFDVLQIPSPGLVTDIDGEVAPASHMNFVIANEVVVVPTFGTASSEEAVDGISELFADRDVVGMASSALLTGGGSFHCITREEPLV